MRRHPVRRTLVELCAALAWSLVIWASAPGRPHLGIASNIFALLALSSTAAAVSIRLRERAWVRLRENVLEWRDPWGRRGAMALSQATMSFGRADQPLRLNGDVLQGGRHLAHSQDLRRRLETRHLGPLPPARIPKGPVKFAADPLLFATYHIVWAVPAFALLTTLLLPVSLGAGVAWSAVAAMTALGLSIFSTYQAATHAKVEIASGRLTATNLFGLRLFSLPSTGLQGAFRLNRQLVIQHDQGEFRLPAYHKNADDLIRLIEEIAAPRYVLPLERSASAEQRAVHQTI